MNILLIALMSIIMTNKDLNMENEIKESIINNYVRGAFNETNIEAFRNIFHPEFAIINLQEDGSFFLFTRDMWEEVLQKRKNDPDFDYSTIALETRFRTIDVEGNRASVTLDLNLKYKTVYTDFLLLMKMKGSWQIVSKIYHQH